MFPEPQDHLKVDEPAAVVRRKAGAAFHSKAEKAWQEYLRTGVSTPVDAVFDRIERRIEAKRLALLAGRS